MLYPLAGCPPLDYGQHFVARELQDGVSSTALDEVLLEVAAANAPNVILSSEEFHALIPSPNFSAIVEGFRAQRYVPVALVYLRGQAFYAESIYAEMLKSGYLSPFDLYVEEIMRTGSFFQKFSGQVIEFQYSRMIAQLEAHLGAGMVVARAYRPGQDAKTLPLEVLEMVGHLSGNLHVSGLLQPWYANASLTLREALDLLRLHSKAPPPLPDLPDAELDARFSLLRFEDVVHFYERFAQDNRDLNARFGIEIPFAKITDVPASDDPRFVRARTQREAIGRIIAALGLL